ncbi:response regulator [Labilibacter marinus]|uniref:response regulator n=1 Tax=Labilibacter marinus TaxID=1477105 RepID=UPI00094FEC66|nr:response regulator transcription factor [Labilibacter marinus]
MSERLKVCIVDDNQYFRDGLRFYIETQTNWDILCEHSSGMEFLKEKKEELPNIVFMDINMPGMNGVETTSRFFENIKDPNVKVIALTMYSSEYHKPTLIEANFSACVLKRDVYKELKSAVDNVINGELYFNIK